MKDKVKKIEVKTRRGTKIIYNPSRRIKPVLGASNWPQLSDAYAVIPESVKEYAEHAAANGVPTEFVLDAQSGMMQAKFNDRSHRRRYMQLMGDFDRNGMYGDA